jgi:NADH:ubiquinone oxidoreductase subunit 6 (subunit J)
MNKKRGCMKLVFVLAVSVFVLFFLGMFINGQAAEELKHNFSLWTIVALVIAINLVSFVSFIFMYAAFRWIKRDFSQQVNKDDELL